MYHSVLRFPKAHGCAVKYTSNTRQVVLTRKVSSSPYSEPSRPPIPLPHSLVTPRSRSCIGYRNSDLIRNLEKQSGKSVLPPETNTFLGNTSSSFPPHLAASWQNKLPQEFSAELSDILHSFKAPIRYAIGYGSGVFPQKSYNPHRASSPMLDFVFAVSHPSHWHSINLQQNPKHYALPLRWLGSAPITWLQEKAPGAGIWFNVENEVNGKLIKYGIISVDTLCGDLLEWNTLYVSGRMHKPVYVIRNDARVRLAQQVNLASALRTALLILPENFTERQLFMTITGLSYTGDFRVTWGENPRKVENIVDQQVEHFRILYRPLIQAMGNRVSYLHDTSMSSDCKLQQDTNPRSQAEILRKLPRGLKEKLETDYTQQWNLKLAKAVDGSSLANKEDKMTSSDEMSFLIRMVTDNGFGESLQRALSLIVGPPAFNQSLKGIISAGPLKSVRYAIPKRKR